MIVEKTNKIIKEEKIRPKKIFGQNFIKDKNVLTDILKASNITSNDYVIEIGPGLGSLTEMLCQKANKILCYEIDNNLASLLPSRLKNYNNYMLINNDFLKCDIENDIKQYLDSSEDVHVVANIPYNITTPIILKLLENKRIKSITLMVQKELAERFASMPSTKEYGSISAYLSYLGTNKIARIVSRNCFEPAPNVDSAVYCFKKNKNETNKEFLDFLRICFAQKRKKLINNLENYNTYSKLEINQLLSKLNIEENIRAEALSCDDLYKIFCLLRFKNED